MQNPINYLFFGCGMSRRVHKGTVRCIYGIFCGEITKYTVIDGVFIRFWPTLPVCPLCLTTYFFWTSFTASVALSIPFPPTGYGYLTSTSQVRLPEYLALLFPFLLPTCRLQGICLLCLCHSTVHFALLKGLGFLQHLRMRVCACVYACICVYV